MKGAITPVIWSLCIRKWIEPFELGIMDEEMKQRILELIAGLEQAMELRMIESKQSGIQAHMAELGFHDMELQITGCKWRLIRIPQ